MRELHKKKNNLVPSFGQHPTRPCFPCHCGHSHRALCKLHADRQFNALCGPSLEKKEKGKRKKSKKEKKRERENRGKKGKKKKEEKKEEQEVEKNATAIVIVIMFVNIQIIIVTSIIIIIVIILGFRAVVLFGRSIRLRPVRVKVNSTSATGRRRIGRSRVSSHHFLRTMPPSYAQGHDSAKLTSRESPWTEPQKAVAHTLASMPMRMEGPGLRSAVRMAPAASQLTESRWNSSGMFSLGSPHCSSSTKSKSS